jgi:D-serine deaminase-like pyridoxal phosphate-dependent protein
VGPFDDLDPAPYRLPETDLARLLSPALLIYLDQVRVNVRRMLAWTGGPERWRPHVKTVKAPALFGELLAAGVRRFKCATLREARTLLGTAREQGVEIDLLIAYPQVGPAVGELRRLAEAFPEAVLAVLCEAPEAVARVPEGVGVFLDLDPGMHRTGLAPDDASAVRTLARAAGARLRGLHWYEGHLHGPLDERRAACHAGYRRLLELADALEGDGHPASELVTSGTPGFRHALEFEGFRDRSHRVSPGTVVLHDLRSAEENPGLGLVPAALLLARVVSRPQPNRVTCDAGSKSIATEAGDPCAAVLGRPELVPERSSEEHLPLRVTRGPAPPTGEPLQLVPRHVCPTVNLAEQLVLVEGGRVTGLAPVSARAHDVLVDP